MRVLTTLPQDDLNRVPDAAQAAEAAGFDGLMTMENKHNPFLPLAVAATTTDEISLATGVAIAFARSPMTVANISWDLQRASKGRFVLGIGSQVKAHNERRFSVPWSAPAPRMREYIEALRAIWRCWQGDGRLDYQGEHYRFTLMTPNFIPEPMEQLMAPITIATVGPAMLSLAGRLADGARLHPFCTRAYLANVVLPRIERGLAESPLERESFEISGGGFIASGPNDEAVAKMVEWVRYRIGFYGSTRAYWPVLAEHDLEDLGQKLLALSREDRWNEMAGEISDDVVHLFAAVGTHETIASAIEARFADAADAINASMNSEMPSDLPPDLIQDIQRIPIKFSGFETVRWTEGR